MVSQSRTWVFKANRSWILNCHPWWRQPKMKKTKMMIARPHFLSKKNWAHSAPMIVDRKTGNWVPTGRSACLSFAKIRLSTFVIWTAKKAISPIRARDAFGWPRKTVPIKAICILMKDLRERWAPKNQARYRSQSCWSAIICIASERVFIVFQFLIWVK